MGWTQIIWHGTSTLTNWTILLVPFFKISNKVNVSGYGSLSENCLSQVQVLEVVVQLVLFEEAVEP